mmetsp:Transcript_2402/g.3513  ORF Transcript_2402/g.3513 Transcript_2402/m.3513 type:complete len:467 (+) Transcript_2402:100-1500(+)
MKDRDGKDDGANYFELLVTHREFRLYLVSYLITNAGEWFTYVASIELTEELLGAEGSSSRIAISFLVVLRVLPFAIFSFLGGALADSADRRKSMIGLDILGAAVGLLYLMAYWLKSIELVFVSAFIQSTVAAFYEPCRSSILPMLVPEDEFMKKANTLCGLAWSVMQAFGALLGGLSIALVGIKNCFVIDCFTYLSSAFFLSLVRGNYLVGNSETTKNYETVVDQIKGMTMDATRYLRSTFFGLLVFVKTGGALVFGAFDVLNVSYSERDPEYNSSTRLGMLFGTVGVGCLIGPLVSDNFTEMKRPETLQFSCIISFVFMSVGGFGFWLFRPFFLICLFTAIRAAGSSILWIDSTILLQKFSAPEMLGRVMAIDFALATAAEAASALLCGFLQDIGGLSPDQVSLVMGILAATFFSLGMLYHLQGGGAASQEALMEKAPLFSGEKSEYSSLQLIPPVQESDTDNQD